MTLLGMVACPRLSGSSPRLHESRSPAMGPDKELVSPTVPLAPRTRRLGARPDAHWWQTWVLGFPVWCGRKMLDLHARGPKGQGSLDFTSFEQLVHPGPEIRVSSRRQDRAHSVKGSMLICCLLHRWPGSLPSKRMSRHPAHTSQCTQVDSCQPVRTTPATKKKDASQFGS